MRFSIRYQLMLPLLALALGLVGVSTWNAWSAGVRARRQLEKQIDDIASTVNAGAFPLNAQTLHLMKGLSGAEYLVCDEQGKPIRDVHDKPVATLAGLPWGLPAPADQPMQHFDRPVAVGSANYLCGAVPLRRGDRSEAILYILYPESVWRDAVWASLRPALTLGLGGSAVSVFLSVLLARQISRRIQQMDERTRLIAQGDFSPMELPRRDDELRDLGQAINDMAGQLAHFQTTIRQTERLRLLGQVSGGLAHQLRNGVAGARLAVQLHVQDCTAKDGTESLAVALRQLSLVEMHLKRFLDLGKAIELRMQRCDLSKLLHDTMELVGPQCRHGGTELRSSETAEMEFEGDPAQLGQLFLNVVTNAIEAAGPGGWVEVRWGLEGKRAFVEIRDSGPGPAPTVAARLFEPFVTGKREGVGLGLAVARQVAEAHGGTIAWRRDAGATCFRIELPCSERPAALPLLHQPVA